MRISDWSSDVCSSDLGTFDSTYLSCDVPFAGGDAGAEAAAFAAGSNNSTGTSTLTGTFINGANEAAVPAYAGLAAINPSFVDVDYIGAVKDANETWWQGWTCGLTKIGRAHVRTPVTNAQLVCRLLLEKKNTALMQPPHTK